MFKLNNIELPEPDGFKVQTVEIGKSGRLSSGKLFKEITAVKDQFVVSWDIMRPAEFDALLAESNIRDFKTFEYMYKGEQKIKTVWLAPLDRTMLLTEAKFNGEFWGQIAITLEEA